VPVTIGLLSDVHASVAPLQHAMEIFRQQQVDMIICAGDIAGYGNELDKTIRILIENHCLSVTGNHDIWDMNTPVQKNRESNSAFFSTLPAFLDLNIEGKRLYVVHANPPDSNRGGIKLLDEQGRLIPGRKEKWSSHLARFEYDVLVVGHTHQVFTEKLGEILLINPGSTKFNHTCMTLRLPEMTTQLFPLAGREPVMTWNWGQDMQEPV